MKLQGFEQILFWGLFVAALSICFRRYLVMLRFIKKGKEGSNSEVTIGRLVETIKYVLGQTCNLKNISSQETDFAAVGHLFLFWGAILVSLNYIIFFFIGDGMGFGADIRNNVLAYGLLYASDVSAVCILSALIAAWARRCLTRPRRLGPKFDATMFTLVTLGGICLFTCYFSLEGLRSFLEMNSFSTLMSRYVAHLFEEYGMTARAAESLFVKIWWGQFAVILGFIIYAPYSHHQHPFFCPLNVLFQSTAPYGQIAHVKLGNGQPFGAEKPEDLTRKQLLEGFACTQCGRCQENCPAYATGKALSPKLIVNGLHNALMGENGNKGKEAMMAMDVFEDILSCTTCGACSEVCPVFNRPLDLVVELRRNLVYQGNLDEGQQTALKETLEYGNPYSVSENSRDNIINMLGFEKAEEGKKYDVLWWVGCSGFFDEGTQNIIRTMQRIMEKAGLTVGALGGAEQCCGDFARRIGDEGLFQKLARDNIKALSRYDFDRIVTHCPHGYNTLKNEYPKMGGLYEVLHHSEFVQELIQEKLITIERVDETVIYHDPCYLGRHNSIYEAPREILKSVCKKQYEFELSHNRSFCCGAGGGHMWKHEEAGERMQDRRVEQSYDCGAKTIVTACPFCLAMIEDALTMKGSETVVKDIALLVEDALC